MLHARWSRRCVMLVTTAHQTPSLRVRTTVERHSRHVCLAGSPWCSLYFAGKCLQCRTALFSEHFQSDETCTIRNAAVLNLSTAVLAALHTCNPNVHHGTYVCSSLKSFRIHDCGKGITTPQDRSWLWRARTQHTTYASTLLPLHTPLPDPAVSRP